MFRFVPPTLKRVRDEEARQALEEGRFTRSVTADDADDSAGRQVKADVVHDDTLAEVFGEAVGADDEVPEALAGRNLDFDAFFAGVDFLRGEFFVVFESGLAFGAAAGRVGKVGVFAFTGQLVSAGAVCEWSGWGVVCGGYVSGDD